MIVDYFVVLRPYEPDGRPSAQEHPSGPFLDRNLAFTALEGAMKTGRFADGRVEEKIEPSQEEAR